MSCTNPTPPTVLPRPDAGAAQQARRLTLMLTDFGSQLLAGAQRRQAERARLVRLLDEFWQPGQPEVCKGSRSKRSDNA